MRCTTPRLSTARPSRSGWWAPVVVALVAIVILGGIKSISKVCEKLVPVMAVFYVVCCLIIIGMNGQFLGRG